MPWFKVKHHTGEIEYQFSLSENALVFDYLQKQQWQFQISEWHPKKLSYKTLLIFYQEIQNGLQSGMPLNQTISHLSYSSSHKRIADTNKALLTELKKGVTFNDALMKLTTPLASPYCHLINAQGTREECEQSLITSIKQLDTLLNWSQRLLKALYYPFCIIQIALIISIGNQFLQADTHSSLLNNVLPMLALYLICSSIQLVVFYQLHQGNACSWLEKYSKAFRLTKLFSLLSSTRKTGVTIQQSLKRMPAYFQHQPTCLEILKVFYKLQLGQNYSSCFPKHWFPKESAIALHSSGQNGDIERALHLATQEHEKNWLKRVSLLEKLIPALCLFIAGGFVASTLMALYAPLLEVN